MPTERTEGDRAAAIVVDAQVIGTKATAKRWGVSERTVRRYQARARVEPVLGAAVAECAKDATKTWLEQTSRVRQHVLAKIEALVALTGPDASRELVRSVLACTKALTAIDEVNVSAQTLRAEFSDPDEAEAARIVAAAGRHLRAV